MSEGALDDADRLLSEVERVAPSAPELWLTKGELAALRGDLDGAMESFDKAAELDLDWPAPIVAAAWIELDENDDPETALALAEDVLEAFADDPIVPQALMIAACAHLAIEQPEEARARLEELSSHTLDEPELLCDLGEAWEELDELPKAKAAFEAALERDPDLADAHYALGRYQHELGNRDEATKHWLKTRELDLASPRSSLVLTEQELETIAESTLLELPEEVRSRLGNVPIFVEDLPSEVLVREGADPRLLGLFTGTPLPSKSHLEGQPTTPDSAILFLRNLEHACGDREELAEQVRITILHETAHFFGLEDEDLEELGLG